MDEAQYNGVVERLQEVNKVIEGLDPAIRADAFKLLEPFITGNTGSGGNAGGGTGGRAGGDQHDPDQEDELDLSAFFAEHGGGRPDQNVLPVAAVIYSRRGAEPFTKQDVQDVADEVGLTLPDRTDKVLKNAKEGANKMFKSAGHGKIQPTVTGETALQSTFGMKKPPRAARATED